MATEIRGTHDWWDKWAEGMSDDRLIEIAERNSRICEALIEELDLPFCPLIQSGCKSDYVNVKVAENVHFDQLIAYYDLLRKERKEFRYGKS